MKYLSFGYLFLFVILLEGCAGPSLKAIPQETTSHLKRIAVISMAAREFDKADFGTLIDYREWKDISEWGIDTIIEQQIASEVQNILGIAVANAPYSIPDFSHVNDAPGFFEGTKPFWLNWRAIKDATINYCSANSLDALLVVSRDGAILTRMIESFGGAGFYVKGKISQMHFVADLALLDCKTGEPIAQRYIDAPRLDLSEEISSLSLTKWSEQQSQQIKSDLISLPRLSWGYALRSMFLSDVQRNRLGRIGEVVSRTKQQYVDDVPDDKLVTGCREGISRYLGTTPNPIQPTVNKSLSSKSVLLDISDILASFKQQSPQFDDDRRLNSACMKGMAGGLDRQSAFLDEDDFQELQYGPKTGNIGLDIALEGDSTKIVSVAEDSPAEKAGLKAGDAIIKVDHVSAKGLSLVEIQRLFRGPVGTNTTLVVTPEGGSDSMEFSMLRDNIRPQIIKWQSVAPGYAYIRVTRLISSTSSLFTQAIEESYRANGGQLKGLILDLRNNPGGLLTEAIAISSAFLPSGSLVSYSTGRTPDSKMRLTAVPEYYSCNNNVDPLKGLPAGVKTVPMVVLVNKATSSGAEIIAAALQDHKRAKIIGTRTIGIGTLATIFPFSNKTALKLTTARLYRPNGMTINELGVTPDTTIEADKLATADFRTADDIQLVHAVRQLGGTVWFYKE